MRRIDRWLWLLLGVLVLVILARVGPHGTPWYGPHLFGGWLWGTGWLFGPVLWAGLIGLVLLLWRRDQAPTQADLQRARSAALEHLSWRFATGELSREQYDELRRTLEPEHPPG
jgi:uncharacterized membrane protein